MRSCVYLLSLAAVFVVGGDVLAHNDRGSLIEGVRWHGHGHFSSGNRVLNDAFGTRVIWGVHERHLNTYDANRNNLTSRGYNDVLVTYRLGKNAADEMIAVAVTIAVVVVILLLVLPTSLAPIARKR